MRAYTKKKGEFPDFAGPVVLTPQRGTGEITVENAVLQVLLADCNSLRRSTILIDISSATQF